MLLLPFDVIQIIELKITLSQWPGLGRQRFEVDKSFQWEDCDAMLVRLLAEEIDHGIRRVFFFVIPINDPGQVGPAQIDHQQNAKQNATPSRAWAGEAPGHYQNQQPERQ